MKNTILALLTLALVLVSQMGFAQTNTKLNNHPMLSEKNDNIWGKLNRASFQNNLKKNIQPAVIGETDIYAWFIDGWFTTGKVNLQYQGDKLTTITNNDFDGESYTPSDRTSLTYTDGLLTQEVYEELNWNTNQLEYIDRTTYGYQELFSVDLLMNIIYSTWLDGWVATGKDDFFYADGIISSGIYFEVVNSNFIENEKFEVTFENDTTAITYYLKVGTEWELSSRELYPGYTPQELFDTFFNLDLNYYGVVFSFPLLIFEFPDVLMQEFIDGNWVNVERISSEKVYEFSSGKLIQELKNFDYWTNEEWVTEQQFEAYFGADSKIDSSKIKSRDELATLVTFMIENYLHDENGNMVEIISKVNSEEGMVNFMRTVIKWAEVATSIVDEPILTKNFYLSPAYPNPFNPTTNIQYSLEQASNNVSIRVYDMLGRQVATLVNGPQMAGSHTIQFDAANLSSGIYYVSMVSGQFKDTRSITLLK